MQLSGHGGRWRVLFPTITITDVGVVGCFGDGMLFLLALALVLSVVVLILAFSAVALSIPSLSLVGDDNAAGVEGLSAATGRIRR